MPEQTPRAEKTAQLLALLKEKYPKTFFSEADKVRPLKIDIHVDLCAALGDEYSKTAVKRALKNYAKTPEYFAVLKKGESRIDLNGEPCGVVSEEHIEIAENAKARQKRRQDRGEEEPTEMLNPSEELVSGRIEVTIKFTQLPHRIKTTKNGWKSFELDVGGKPIRITIRPKNWTKLEKLAGQYLYWIAAIKGRMGNKVKYGGFELLEPAVQVFERNPSSPDEAPNIVKVPPKVDSYREKPALMGRPDRKYSGGNRAPSGNSHPNPNNSTGLGGGNSGGNSRPTTVVRKKREIPAHLMDQRQRPTLGLKKKSTLGLKKHKED